jgi:hypothetical protein
MWQGHVSRLTTFEERKRVVETEVPESMKERVISHLRTVKALKEKAK